MASDRWEKFAREAPEYYIFTERQPAGLSAAERRRLFFASGESDVTESLARIQEERHGWGRAVEIGCGIGRLTLPLARRFAEVRAVDVAPTMLALLRGNAEMAKLSNISPFLPGDGWDEGPGLDYVYSFIVFQHIEDFSIIQNYVMRIGQALLPTGVAQLQFDTRPFGLTYRIRSRLPDFVLPRSQRGGIRRVRRHSTELVEVFNRAGLSIVEQYGVATAYHTFVLRVMRDSPGPPQG